MISALNLKGQDPKSNLELIRQHTLESHEDHLNSHRHLSFLLSDHPSSFVRFNPLTLTFGSLMWTYQKIISPQFSSTCLYSPSCSAYSMDLISEYGLLKGIILTSERLTRCNRLSLMDYKSWEADLKSGKIREETKYYKLR